jgi:hypothetical protein
MNINITQPRSQLADAGMVIVSGTFNNLEIDQLRAQLSKGGVPKNASLLVVARNSNDVFCLTRGDMAKAGWIRKED